MLVARIAKCSKRMPSQRLGFTSSFRLQDQRQHSAFHQPFAISWLATAVDCRHGHARYVVLQADGSAGGSASSAKGSQEDMLARIARAKQYKEGSSGSRGPAPAELPRRPASPPQPQPLLGSLGSSQPSPPLVGSCSSEEFLLSSRPQPAASAAGVLTSTNIKPGMSPPPLLSTQLQPSSLPPAPLAPPGTQQQHQPEHHDSGADDTESNASAPSTFFQQYERDGVQSSEDYLRMMMQSRGSSRQGAGSADQAADWLQGVLADRVTGPQQGNYQRMEDFTVARELAQRAAGANIITGGVVGVRGQAYGEAAAEAAAAAAASEATAARLPPTAASPAAGIVVPDSTVSAAEQGTSASAAAPRQSAMPDGTAQDQSTGYKPTVSTWGVFPRPSDISKAYGGGRTIRPGQALETDEQRLARERSFLSAMAQYKKTIGAEVDPEVEAEAGRLEMAGSALLKAGKLQEAYDKLHAAASMVPLKSKVGGQATLQKAIVLDSSGESKAAEKLYRSLQGHPVPAVSKKAKQLLFGFQAMDFLKAEQYSYAAKNGDFTGYFRRIADRNKVYIPTEEDRITDAAQARTATLIAIAVLVGPVAAFVILALGRGV